MIQTNLTTFNPTSWPCYPGTAFVAPGRYVKVTVNQEDIEKSLNELRLEDAKNAIYHCYGNSSYPTQTNLLRIVQKIVELNAGTLSDQHKDMNYTLDAAHSMGCHMYTIAYNEKYHKYQFMQVAVNALTTVAECYAKKNDYCKAVDCLGRLDEGDKVLPLKGLFERWKKYIEKDCPTENKDRENFLYRLRYKPI